MSPDDEINKLKKQQKEIENYDLDEMAKHKLRSRFWEHELGWLDLQMEIELIEKEKQK